MADLLIKPDPDSKSPAVFDEDIYEDAGDLEFNTDPNFQSVFMAKIPRYVWQSWSKLDDDAEIRIGTIRQSVVRDGNRKKEHMQMLLSPEIGAHQMIPKEYDLELIDNNVNNTFIFTEQDLPGYKSKSNQKFDPAVANIPNRLTLPSKIEKPRQPYDPNKKFTPYFRKAIPKRTVLAARVKQELNCAPVDNNETRHLMKVMTEEAMRPKHKTKFLNRDLDHGEDSYKQPGSLSALNSMTGFIKTDNPKASRPQFNKAARMPENELLDRIFKCFERYNYWSIKALRAELHQPEAYLRETLEKIAVLAKSGRFSSHWSLKPENRPGNYENALEEAPDDQDSDTGMEDDDDDEDVKFEDVA